MRGGGTAITTGKANPSQPEFSNLNDLFIDTKEKVKLWP
jgi:hypothetical protein